MSEINSQFNACQHREHCQAMEADNKALTAQVERLREAALDVTQWDFAGLRAMPDHYDWRELLGDVERLEAVIAETASDGEGVS